MPDSSSPDEQGHKNNGEKGTQTDPTVRENLTFKYLEACCEGECPQKDCSDTDIPQEPPANSCPAGPVTSLDRPCGESPPCAATTDKCLAYTQTDPRSQTQGLTPSGDQGGQPQPAPSGGAVGPQDDAACRKGDCPGFLEGPPSGRPVSPIPSGGGQQPPSRDGCPKVPCPSNNPDGEYICRPTPCPGAGLQPSPSQGGMSGRSGGPMAAGGPPTSRSDAAMGVDCKKHQCPAVQAALEAAYGTGGPTVCPGGPGVCDPNRPGSPQILQPGQPSGRLSPQRSGASVPMGSGYPSAGQMGPEGARGLSPQRSGISGQTGPCGQPSGTSQGPCGQMSTGPSGQMYPGGQGSQHPSAMSGMRSDGQLGRQPSGQTAMSAQGPAGMTGQGGFGSKCPADQGLWPQYRRQQPTIKCTGKDTCPRQNPALLGPLSPLAQMYLDMSKPKHDWGQDPFKPGDVAEGTQTGSARPGSRGKGEEGSYGRNRITLSFAKNLHPVIDVSLTEADGYEDGDIGGNLDSCCGRQKCCRMCK